MRTGQLDSGLLNAVKGLCEAKVACLDSTCRIGGITQTVCTPSPNVGIYVQIIVAVQIPAVAVLDGQLPGLIRIELVPNFRVGRLSEPE